MRVVRGAECEDMILDAVEKMADAVGSTMGPGGRLVMFDSGFQLEEGKPIPSKMNLFPQTTKDGVTVAMRGIPGGDARQPALMVVQNALAQLRDAGDGTTLTTVLLHRMLYESIMVKRKMGRDFDALAFITCLGDYVHRIQEIVVSMAKSCTDDDIRKIAKVSTNGDYPLSAIISEAVIRSGEHGKILVQQTKRGGTRYEVIPGYSFESGLMSPAFRNTPTHYECQEANVLVTDMELRVFGRDIAPILSKYNQMCGGTSESEAVNAPPLLLFAPLIEGDALQSLSVMMEKSSLRVIPVKLEGYASVQEHCIRDIAAYTGAIPVLDGEGKKLVDVGPEHFGNVGSAKISVFDTIITPMNGITVDKKRMDELNALLTHEDEFHRGLAEKSLARLTSGYVKIFIQAKNETEGLEIADRVDDAIRACRAAKKSGYVVGAGCALLHAFDKFASEKGKDFQVQKVLEEALSEPARRIITNAGKKPEILIEKVREGAAYAYPDFFPIHTQMAIERGIIDPVLVVTSALENSFSMMKNLLLTETIFLKD
jgi:chaperonin GroEL